MTALLVAAGSLFILGAITAAVRRVRNNDDRHGPLRLGLVESQGPQRR